MPIAKSIILSMGETYSKLFTCCSGIITWIHAYAAATAAIPYERFSIVAFVMHLISSGNMR